MMQRRAAGFARPVATTTAALLVLLLLLLTMSATPAEAGALQRIMNARTHSVDVVFYETLDEIKAAAQALGTTLQGFFARADVSPTLYKFDCSDGSAVVEACLAKLEGGDGGLCVGSNWTITDPVTGEETIINGAAGKDVCRYSACSGMTCRDPVLNTVYESTDQTQCSCMNPIDINGTSFSTQLNSSSLWYNADSPNYPRNNTYVCSYYRCDATQDDQYPSFVVYDYHVRACMCYYPADRYDAYYASQYSANITTWPKYSATLTSTTMTPPATTTSTPDPAGTDEPGPTVTNDVTDEPGFDQLELTRSFRHLCPNYPPALTNGILNSNLNGFCCSVFLLNKTVVTCGAEAYFGMPVGWGFCESTIPSFSFCCEVERMHRDTFVYRGSTCARDLPPETTFDSASILTRKGLTTVSGTVLVAALLAAMW